jgi:hypothetical protein
MSDDVATEVADEVDVNNPQTPGYAAENTEDEDLSVAGEDISGAQPLDRTDVVEPAKGVVMTIKSVTLDKYTPRDASTWNKISMKPTLVVDEAGIDGKGRYKNKHFFPRILIAVNREAYADQFSGKFYEPRVGGAFGDYNMFLKALGISTSPAPTNDKAFRKSLEGRKIIVDITKDHRRVFDEGKKKWVNSDEFENNLVYRGQPKAAPQPNVETASA